MIFVRGCVSESAGAVHDVPGSYNWKYFVQFLSIPPRRRGRIKFLSRYRKKKQKLALMLVNVRSSRENSRHAAPLRDVCCSVAEAEGSTAGWSARSTAWWSAVRGGSAKWWT